MVDLLPLFERINASTVLSDSVRLLVEGLAEVLTENASQDVVAALRGLVRHPDNINQQIAMGTLLAQALTRNTSHVPIDVRDEVGSLRANLIDRLDRMPDKDKAAEHAEAIRTEMEGAVLRIDLAKADRKAARS